jgi:hypothetical protein
MSLKSAIHHSYFIIHHYYTIMSKYSFFLIIFLFLFNCKNKEPRIINLAFHHWKSQLKLTEFETQYCENIKANTLYLRLFDVDYNALNKFAEPISELSINKNNLIDFNSIIPTVFITNRTLINLNDKQIDSLSTLIITKLSQITEGSIFELKNDDSNLKNNNQHLKNSIFSDKINELLIDCDWTATTKTKYFQLIKQLKTQLNGELNAQLINSDKELNKPNKQLKITTTIRLHQIKFSEKTGIPPADKGLLMAYNTGDLSDPQTINSILDINVLKAYLAELNTYPLQLDIALPIFSWGIVKRDGQAVQLIPNFNTDFLLKNDKNTEGVYFENKNDNTITILKNGYYNSYYLYADDVIKTEEISLNTLKEAATLLSEHVNNPQLTLSFFSLDSVNLKRYNPNDLTGVSNCFK